jgi:hypothetical protein
MQRQEWESVFLEELLKLRPHLRDEKMGGANRLAFAIATAEYHTGADPVAAARQWHQRNAPARKK